MRQIRVSGDVPLRHCSCLALSLSLSSPPLSASRCVCVCGFAFVLASVSGCCVCQFSSQVQRLQCISSYSSCVAVGVPRVLLTRFLFPGTKSATAAVSLLTVVRLCPTRALFPGPKPATAALSRTVVVVWLCRSAGSVPLTCVHAYVA